MTTRREVPFAGDTLAWVHSELAEIKSKLVLIQQASEQSRGIATDAADVAHQTRTKLDQFDGQSAALVHVQDDLRVLREQITRSQEDIHSLRQSREEIERWAQGEAERARQDKNDVAHRFADFERLVDAWQERQTGTEEHNRRTLEAGAQLAVRIEALETNYAEFDNMQGRYTTAISRLDQEVQRITATAIELQREDDVHRERSSSAFEALRRLEAQIEAVQIATNRISRLDDRLELVQAERSRHNERLTEISVDLNKIDTRLNEQTERIALIEVRITGYQDELRGLRELLQQDREQIAGYVHSISELESDIRKRQIIALEKEMRDFRGRTLNFPDE